MFNANVEGIASGCPCTRECPNRNPFCHSTCEEYKKWQIVQKHYSNKVKAIRKKMGGGIGWYQTKGNIRGSR